jgi:hypothetical protein
MMDGDAYKDFNRAVKGFLRDLIARFPGVSEFKLVFVSYKLLKTVGRKKPMAVFDRIFQGDEAAARVMAKDETYFMRTDLDVDDVLSGLRQAAAREWGALEQESKDAVWRHLQVMVVLSHKARNMPLRIGAPEQLHREGSCRF